MDDRSTYTQLDRATLLQNDLIGHATGGSADDKTYRSERAFFIAQKQLDDLLPGCVKTNRDLFQFWSFIKHKFSTYAERRQFIYGAFAPLLERLEGTQGMPADGQISNKLKEFSTSGVQVVWQRALDRRTDDPEGAITAAKSLLESVCKHILDELGVTYDDKSVELHALYKKTAELLQLAPELHTNDLFKRILGSVSGVVSGLGQVRNELGDAHGKGKVFIKPKTRHAEFVVNLAGTTALFLVETYNEQKADE
jgi:hypothetical protein